MTDDNINLLIFISYKISNFFRNQNDTIFLVNVVSSVVTRMSTP